MGQSAIDVVVDLAAFRALPYWKAMATVGVPPHVSVLFPWREAPLSGQDLDDLRVVIDGVQSFTLRLGGVDAFPNGTVYASVERSEPLSSLMRRTWEAFPETPPYGGQFDVPQPHLTLAKCAEEDVPMVVGQLRDQLGTRLPLQVHVSTVTVLEQQPDDTWRAAGEIALR